MTRGNPRDRAPADQRQALYVTTAADDNASQRPAQNRRPDGLAQDLGLDLHRLVAFPSEAGAEIQCWDGLWHSGWPGHLMRIVILQRDGKVAPEQLGPLKPLPALEALSTTELAFGTQDILNEYGDRWTVEIAIRDANASDRRTKINAARGRASSVPTCSI